MLPNHRRTIVRLYSCSYQLQPINSVVFTILTTGILLFCSPQYPQKLELSLMLSKGLNEYGLGEELTVDSKFQACLYHGRQRELGPVLALTACQFHEEKEAWEHSGLLGDVMRHLR